MFKLKYLPAFFALLALVAFIPSAQAANTHFIGDVQVTTDLDDLTVTVSGKIAGLGKQDTVISVDVAGSVDILVYNPSSKLPPGINKTPFHSLGKVILKPDAKNGTVSFSIVVDLQPAIDAAVAHTKLPNSHWVAEAQDVTIDSVTVTVEQPAGHVVLTQTFDQ